MGNNTRFLTVSGGNVRCLPEKSESVDKCRFCVHSVKFQVNGKMVDSPARAYCLVKRTTDKVEMSSVEAVECDDASGEGFRSMMNVIG